jgi:AraC-like DNA-binding protein
LTVPEAALTETIDLPIGEPVPITSPTLLSRSVTAFLVELSSGAEEPLSAIDRYSLERFVQEMVTALVLNRMQLVSPPKQRDLVASARAAIVARCTDPLLDTAAVAEDCNVSVRTLERVLAESGTSPRHEIRRARIEYAISLLRNADYDSLGIDQIAAHAQFSNGSSLARAMRAEGYPPPPARFDSSDGITQNVVDSLHIAGPEQRTGRTRPRAAHMNQVALPRTHEPGRENGIPVRVVRRTAAHA